MEVIRHPGGVSGKFRKSAGAKEGAGPLHHWEEVVSEFALPLSQQLIGTDEATIDDKGRLLVSKKKRDRLGEPFVMALKPIGCIGAYPEAAWNQMVFEILRNPSINQGRQEYTRLTIGTAEDDLKFDKQGRVVVPLKLREAANIKDKVFVIGCIDHMEVWSQKEWGKYQADQQGYGKERREAVERAYRQMTGRE